MISPRSFSLALPRSQRIRLPCLSANRGIAKAVDRRSSREREVEEAGQGETDSQREKGDDSDDYTIEFGGAVEGVSDSIEGGCRCLCDMGTCDPSILGLLCSFFILWAHAACFNLALCYNATATMHEDHKASQARPEKEAKDASAIIYVELSAIATLPVDSPSSFTKR
ncbi:hypothetical protein SAY86_010552 [Trapa natans]|uniref:Uncharacterized protein n=1 Tax=Trapa natans TaxID=22666 RepID=A0AAN7LLU1_TRANT|nr:hypothetical protein SAY86_010552 [Trapa natans]